jgi:hypothetical protein
VSAEKCGACGMTRLLSAPIAVILVFVPGLPRPYPLIPDEDYRVCLQLDARAPCRAAFCLVDKACAAHWTSATLISTDPHAPPIRLFAATRYGLTTKMGRA